MKTNCYTLDSEFIINEIKNYNLPNEVVKDLQIIENEIVFEFLNKQKGKLGIKNLGNELRYNTTLKNKFNNIKDNRIIIKLTENRRAFIKVFIDSWISFDEKEIYFFILESEFGYTSNMVDKSFIRIQEIRDELELFKKHFRTITPGPRIVFIEMKGFDNYHLIQEKTFTKLQVK